MFSSIVSRGGVVECRSNWQTYVDEFAAALVQLSGKTVASVATEALPADPVGPLTPFEEKYQRSGHRLWMCRLQLNDGTTGTRGTQVANDAAVRDNVEFSAND